MLDSPEAPKPYLLLEEPFEQSLGLCTQAEILLIGSQ